MIEIRDATQEDFEYVKNNPIDANVVKDFMDKDKPLGWCKTAFVDGKIVGIGGVVVIWPHVGVGWYCLSKEANNHKAAMVVCIKKIIMQATKELDLHRLESTIRVDFIRAIKLAEFVGFKCEGRMEQYTQEGIDCFLYAIVRKKPNGT